MRLGHREGHRQHLAVGQPHPIGSAALELFWPSCIIGSKSGPLDLWLLLLMALLGPFPFQADAADAQVWAHCNLQQHLPMALLRPIKFA